MGLTLSTYYMTCLALKEETIVTSKASGEKTVTKRYNPWVIGISILCITFTNIFDAKLITTLYGK